MNKLVDDKLKVWGGKQWAAFDHIEMHPDTVTNVTIHSRHMCPTQLGQPMSVLFHVQYKRFGGPFDCGCCIIVPPNVWKQLQIDTRLARRFEGEEGADMVPDEARDV